MSVQTRQLYDGTEDPGMPEWIRNDQFDAQMARATAIELRAAERFVIQGEYGKWPHAIQMVFVRGQIDTQERLATARRSLAEKCAPWFEDQR